MQEQTKTNCRNGGLFRLLTISTVSYLTDSLAYLSMSAVLDNSIGEGRLGLGLIVSSGSRRRAQYGKREKRVKVSSHCFLRIATAKADMGFRN